MKWTKFDHATTVQDVVLRNTGLQISDFTNQKMNYHITNLQEVTHMIFSAIQMNIPITIYGDYDADGVTSTTILFLLLKSLNAQNVTIILPKRFSEGYGLSMKGIDRVHKGLLITVDNGITAIDQIKVAKEKGLKVIVLDHHLRREDGQLPCADLIVDPNAIEGSDFNGYCAAGLTFKLAQIMSQNEILLKQLNSLAAIATVADVMSLIHDNRNIVINGLANINQGFVPLGLRVLIQALGLSHINEEDCGFKFGPIINAAGRMLDNGAEKAFQLLSSDNEIDAQKLAEELIEINEKRKVTVADNLMVCEQIIASDCMYGENPLVVYTTKNETEQFHEGVVGILAGKLAEKYKCPTLILTETETGILKGSGRTYGTLHLKELLDSVSESLFGYGGHAGAVGLKVKLENIEKFKRTLQNQLAKAPDYTSADIEEEFYDLEIIEEQLPEFMRELKNFAPFGEGNPKVVFCVKNLRLIPCAGKPFRLIGNKGQHIKLFGQHFDIIAFDMADTYKELGEPITIDVLGYIGENYFNGQTKLQIEAVDIRKSNVKSERSSLAMLLEQKMSQYGLR